MNFTKIVEWRILILAEERHHTKHSSIDFRNGESVEALDGMIGRVELVLAG